MRLARRFPRGFARARLLLIIGWNIRAVGHLFQRLTVEDDDASVIPSAPVLKAAPPSGDGWLHEVKFDGWRAQLHKRGDDVVIFTRNGHDYTGHFPAVRDSLLSLPARSAIIDAEIVVCDSDDKPDFDALMEMFQNRERTT